jgi:hypothetical protein
MDNKNSPLKAYIIGTHLAWLVISPLLIFIGGGSWLVDYMNWDNKVKILFVLAGIAVMIISTGMYLRNLIRMYDDSPENPPKTDKNDYDY